MSDIIIREAAVSGKFYTEKPNILSQEIDIALENSLKRNPFAPEDKGSIFSPKVIVVPHAGYRFCLQVAAEAYTRIYHSKSQIKRVVMLSPSHYFPLQKLALPESSYFQTPLGKIPVEQSIYDDLLQKFSFIEINEEVHKPEHGLEVHLPILQRVIRDDFSIIPFVVGNVPIDKISELIDYLWGEEETCILISTDLSHYLENEEAMKIDHKTKRMIEQVYLKDFTGQNACGVIPLASSLLNAQKRALRISTLYIANSYQTTGLSPERVVGYGSWIFEEQNTTRVPERYRNFLIHTAVQSIVYYLKEGKEITIKWDQIPYELQTIRATFVTLKLNGQLRGCIGSLQARNPLLLDIVQNAIKAAFNDPRFPAIQAQDLALLSLEISILSPLAPLAVEGENDLVEKMTPEKDGFILMDNDKQGTFLPSVWEQLPDKRDFLNGLKRKAGISDWSDSTKVIRYQAEKFAKDIKNFIKMK